MADNYARDTLRLTCTGLDLNHPIDQVAPNKFPDLRNVRSITEGEITNAPGLTDIAAVITNKTPVHSIRRLNDPRNSSYTRIIGVQDRLAYGQSSFTDADGPYSGNPLALIPYRPEGSPDPWMYVGDSTRMRKIRRDGTLHTIGLPAPSTPIGGDSAIQGLALSVSPNYWKAIDEFDATTGWGNTGTAGAPSLLSAGPGYRTTSTIAQIKYNTGTSGWALVNLTSMAGVGVGERLTFNPGGGSEEIATVQEVHPGSVSTTIASIIYESGTSGMCSIVLTDRIEQIEANSLLRNSTRTENVRVLSVTRGPDGTVSFRCVTSATFAAADTVQILASMYINLNNGAGHAAGETVRTDGVRTTITVGQGALSKTTTIDLSILTSGVATHPDDYMHISIRVDRPDLVTEGKLLLDVDATTQDFTRNFYFHAFRASDITPAARNLQPLITTRQNVLQRVVIDQRTPDPETGLFPPDPNFVDPTTGLPVNIPPGSTLNSIASIDGYATYLAIIPVDPTTSTTNTTSQEMDPGDVQWIELKFRLSDLTRVGTDETRTLQNVAAIRILLTVTGTVILDLDSWWISGGFEPDTGSDTSIPYIYRYRARHPSTNVASNFSPASRFGISPLRQSVNIGITQYPLPSGFSGSATDFVIDLERFGGEIADWRYLGTITNASTIIFNDNYSDSIIGANPKLINDNYQPWPISDIPRTGTCTVSGTLVNDSGTNFNTSWAQGTRILINNAPYTIYRILSTSRLEIMENAGTQTSVTWRIDEPLLLAQPLPCLWEHDDTFFACGDIINPGRLYYSRRASETTQASFTEPDGSFKRWGYLDITNPSEPLMNGLAFNARSMLFSSDRMFQILPTGNPSTPWRYDEIPNGIGLLARWAIPQSGLKSPWIPFLGKDGIYKTNGGAPSSLTDRDLYPLFPNEGNPGANSTLGIISPSPNMADSATQPYLRMEIYDDYVYFDYTRLTTPRQHRTLVFASNLDGWFYDEKTGINMHYGEEGPGVHSILCGGDDATSAHLYQLTGNSDNGTPIACRVQLPCRDQSAPRLNKLYGDMMVDLAPAGVTVSFTPSINNVTTAFPVITTSAALRSQVTIPLGSSWQTGLNISTLITWSVNSSSQPKLYIWEARWTFESAPIAALSWEISPNTFGLPNFKHMGIYRITHVSTADLSLIITVDGVVQPTITIPHGSGAYRTTVGRFPVYKGKLYKARIASTIDWRLDTLDSFIEVRQWGDTGAYNELRMFQLAEG